MRWRDKIYYLERLFGKTTSKNVYNYVIHHPNLVENGVFVYKKKEYKIGWSLKRNDYLILILLSVTLQHKEAIDTMHKCLA